MTWETLQSMKGPSKLVAVILAPQGTINLLLYPDGSLEIDQEGTCIGLWEPEETELCMRKFFSFAQAGENLEEAIARCRLLRQNKAASVLDEEKARCGTDYFN